jgi:polysaccharide export outer membrane protein
MITDYKFSRCIFFLSIIALFMLNSCVSQHRVTLLQGMSEGTNSFDNSKKITHHVQTGDHLYIRIYSVDPKTSKFFQTDLPALMNPTYLYLNSYVVDEQGYISFSFIEKMFVKGLTVEEIKNQLQKSVNEYFKEATVVVRLVDFQVAVLGEVNTPGNFTIDKDQINIFQAIGMAGGIKDFANIKKVKIVRQTLKGSEVYIVDLRKKDILQSDYFYLMPNDIVYIQPMGSKSFAFEKFPYAILVSLASLGVTIMTYLEVVKD